MADPHPILRVYARNVEIWMCRRALTPADILREVGALGCDVSPHAVTNLRRTRGRWIDPELLAGLLDLFDCTPNDLLLPQPGVDYTPH